MWAYASAMYAKINAHAFQTSHGRKHVCIPSTVVLEKIYNGDKRFWMKLPEKKPQNKIITLESSITNIIILI